ncbi:MAG: phage major capsid protein [Pseudomonadota bacterium]
MSRTLAQLRAEKETKKAEAGKALDAIEAAGGFGADAEADARYAALKAEVDALDPEIAKAEKLADARRQMQPTTATPALATGTTEPNPATTGGFRSLAEFATSVREAVVGSTTDRRLMGAPSNVHSGNGTGAGEGYLIPAQYRDEIWTAVTGSGDDFVGRFTLEPTAARTIEYCRDETTPWGAAGVTAQWRAEAAQMTPSKLRTDASRMEIHDLFAFAAVTEEMLADAPRVQSHLTRMAARAISWKIGEAIMRGDGVGKPLGILKSKALIAQEKESEQAAATIVTKNVLKMWTRKMRTEGARLFWLTRDETMPELATTTIGDQPVYLPAGGLSEQPLARLMGLPVVESEHAGALGEVGDLVLINPDGYMAAVRSAAPEFASSIHLWFDYNLGAFRWTWRMGGQPILSKPIEPAKGTTTKSHFVALAARA